MTPHSILIVDSDTRAAQVTGALISRSLPDATLRVEPTPERGWASFQQDHPDVLIIDPSMNSPAGVQLIRRIKGGQPAAWVIVLTSSPTPALRRRMSDLGVDVYLEKSAPLEQLLAQLERISSSALDSKRADGYSRECTGLPEG